MSIRKLRQQQTVKKVNILLFKYLSQEYFIKMKKMYLDIIIIQNLKMKKNTTLLQTTVKKYNYMIQEYQQNMENN